MDDNKTIVLFEKKEDCCACGACMNVCPKNAITMVEDKCGFRYPQIDKEKCIGCGACKKACAYQNIKEENTPLETFAAVNRSEGQKLLSTSGGMFAAFATKILSDGGIVFGCALEQDDDRIWAHHIAIDKLSELPRLQGSKYVQSSTDYTYKEVLEFLKQGRTVLYSGTPCQIAGLKGFLRKDYDNLILVDLVCHGVPNSKMFNEYLSELKVRRKWKKITGYSFRDKKKGWGHNCRIDAVDEKGKEVSLYTPARLASFNTLFLDGLIFRENCYSCKYASKNRPGDITIGDYWGIANEHPELIGCEGFDEDNGISCLIANTAKGAALCREMDEFIDYRESAFEKVAKMNKQLNRPLEYNPKRDKIMGIYENEGYNGLEKLYKEKYRKQRIVHYIFNKLPRNTRNMIKKIKG